MTPIVRGVCDCGYLQFELKKEPLFVHACHCLDCKRKSGSSFGITCIVLEEDIHILNGALRKTKTSPRTIAYLCSRCNVAIYKVTSGFKATALLQTGCLTDVRQLNIGAHIWVNRKDDWLQLPEAVLRFEEGYHPERVWSKSSLDRLEKQIAGAK